MDEPALTILDGCYAVCRLPRDAAVPGALLTAGNGFVSITRTADELSIVCPEALTPPGAEVNRGWRAFKVEGPLDFSLTGVLSTLLEPLAAAKISVFAVATYDTDYILVREADFAAARWELARFLRL